MSVSLLNNAGSWLDLNVKSVTIPEYTFATGAITWMGTAIAGGIDLIYSINGNYVTLYINVPTTEATANAAFSFTNPLPEEIRPSAPVSCAVFLADTTTPANSKTGGLIIDTDGMMSGVLSGGATDTDSYTLNAVVQYHL
jgi:hypothetical protein